MDCSQTYLLSREIRVGRSAYELQFTQIKCLFLVPNVIFPLIQMLFILTILLYLFSIWNIYDYTIVLHDLVIDTLCLPYLILLTCIVMITLYER